MRTSKEITEQFSQLCMQLGNTMINFEMHKSKALAEYMELNKEMQEATAREAKELADKMDKDTVLANELLKLNEQSQSPIDKKLKGKK